MHRSIFAALVVLGCLAAVANATVTITAGAHNLQPNLAGQKVTLTVTTDAADRTAGVAMRIGIGDQLGTAGQPIMTAVDTITGTMFAPSNTGNASTFTNGTKWNGGTTTNPATNLGDGVGIVAVSSSSLAATVTIDTTGINSGVFAFAVSWISPPLGTTYTNTGNVFPNVVMARVNGTLTVVQVPEPSSIVLGLFAAAGLGAVVIRRRARKA